MKSSHGRNPLDPKLAHMNITSILMAIDAGDSYEQFHD